MTLFGEFFLAFRHPLDLSFSAGPLHPQFQFQRALEITELGGAEKGRATVFLHAQGAFFDGRFGKLRDEAGIGGTRRLGGGGLVGGIRLRGEGAGIGDELLD
ncbi:MAG: hypothetical protein KDN19_23930, partial [Verrucomicrobiae bacterium]|nr:hypothetical protein [Verrucomicrobiae bacterium]